MISGIILAAGTSSRLGRPKQLLDLGGKPVIQHVVNAALASPLDEIVVVVGHAAEEILAALPAHPRIRPVMNPDFARGQSTSLRVGLESCDDRSEAVVVLLGDQPEVPPQAIVAVIDSWRRDGRPIVQASYGGRPAHPVLFAREAWARLEGTQGDEGARSFLADGASALVEMGGSPPEDIDTEDDYARAMARLRSIDPR
jgi:molybdenum cofactor cytidylyltransferase